MPPMLVTADTSHAERFPLKAEAEVNIWRIVVTADTSHAESF